MRYAAELRSLSHGTGTFTRRYLRHEAVPAAKAAQLTASAPVTRPHGGQNLVLVGTSAITAKTWFGAQSTSAQACTSSSRVSASRLGRTRV